MAYSVTAFLMTKYKMPFDVKISHEVPIYNSIWFLSVRLQEFQLKVTWRQGGICDLETPIKAFVFSNLHHRLVALMANIFKVALSCAQSPLGYVATK